jgi:thiamine biosynthesis protein ThiS
MKLNINGEPKEVNPKEGNNEPSTLLGILQFLQINTNAKIAVAINGTVIYRDNWSKAILSDGDEVTIITSAQGG